MNLSKEDIEILHYHLKEENKKTHSCILLRRLLKGEKFKEIQSAVKWSVPRTRNNLNTQLKKIDYYIEKKTYIIKKIIPNSSKKLISEINNFLIENPTLDEIIIKVFHSNMSAPIEDLNKSLKKMQDTNSKYKVEITTSITAKDDKLISGLKSIRKSTGHANFKTNFKVHRLNTSIAETLNIFLVLIMIKDTKTLFLFDNEKYIPNKKIEDIDIIYILKSYSKIIITGANKTIDIDRIISQLKSEKKSNLLARSIQ